MQINATEDERNTANVNTTITMENAVQQLRTNVLLSFRFLAVFDVPFLSVVFLLLFVVLYKQTPIPTLLTIGAC